MRVIARNRTVALGLAGLLIALSVSATQGAGSNTKPVSIRFALKADGVEVGCGAPLRNIGVSRVEARLHDARLYVYGVKLIDAKGARTPLELARNDWQYADLALLDFKDARGGNSPCSESNPAKNTSISGTVARGAYLGLEFSVGVPDEGQVDGKTVALNHSAMETSPPPLDIAAMAWNWQGGRKFVLMEFDPPKGVFKADGSKAPTWMLHLGSAGCKGNPATGEMASCARQNRFTVTFDRFDPATQRVELDLTRLLENSDVTADRGNAVGCMSSPDDPECPAIFEALGLNSAESAPGAGDAGKQTKPGVSPIFSLGAIKTAELHGGKQ